MNERSIRAIRTSPYQPGSEFSSVCFLGNLSGEASPPAIELATRREFCRQAATLLEAPIRTTLLEDEPSMASGPPPGPGWLIAVCQSLDVNYLVIPSLEALGWTESDTQTLREGLAHHNAALVIADQLLTSIDAGTLSDEQQFWLSRPQSRKNWKSIRVVTS